MDATKKTILKPKHDIADHELKAIRKDKNSTTKNRLGNKSLKSGKANEKMKKDLECILPYLASLPDKLLHEPAISLASAVLSKAIARKHKQEVLYKSTNSENFIPTSARINFKLGATNNIVAYKKSKNLTPRRPKK